MKRSIDLTDSQIELILQNIQLVIEIQKTLNSKKYSTENEINKISEYTDLYKIIAEQYYEEQNVFKKFSKKVLTQKLINDKKVS